MATVSDLIVAALKEIVVIAAGETPAAADATDAFDTLNRMVNAWKAERVFIYQNAGIPFQLTGTFGQYTLTTDSVTCVGGATVVVTGMKRFSHVNNVNILDTTIVPPYELGLRLMTDEDWANVRIKTQQALRPTAVYVNYTYPSINLYFWPIPTSTTLYAVVYFPDPISEFTGLSQTVSLPAGYERMIVKNLAVELAPMYGKTPNELLMRQAQDSLAVVLRANKNLEELRFEPAALVHRPYYDIYSDQG